MSRTGLWLRDHPPGAKGAKPTLHSPELAHAMAKNAKAKDKKRTERWKKATDGKTRMG